MILIHFGLTNYGFSLFVFLPFILGTILGDSLVKNISLYGLSISFGVFISLLLIGKLEGMVCILLALPIIFFFIALGFFIRYLLGRKQSQEKDKIKSTIAPYFIFLIISFSEKHIFGNDQEIIVVKTEMILPYNSMQVYDAIKSVDTLIAEKPFLMKLDLPIPTKCILEKEEVGGLRTCHFSGGSITEKITELERGKLLKMDVIEYQLTGRKWLGFREAIYYFEKITADSSKITRVTTYSSELKPRFYWEPLEKWAIAQEHEYVFENLKRDLGK
ncbi:MAG TPA: hypothetical protein PK006_07905 [Saprospiraceae bacterium]|nr:hypothetical protein [Saprospiraceae bacterium]